MEKPTFFNYVAAIYRAANTADNDACVSDWMRPEMAGDAGCAALDTMLRNMVACGVLKEQELQEFYDNM